MKIKRALIVYKKSSYETHVISGRDPHYLRLLREGSVATRGSKRIHQEHVATFHQIKRVLSQLRIRHDLRLRYHLGKIRGYDLVITIGGDGTFLETTHFLEEGVLMGVNSAPMESVGFFCRTDRRNFGQKIAALMGGRQRLQKLSRLRLILPGRKRIPFALNDILFANRNPAATTRYLLKVGNKGEEQKSSGLWVAPAAGSTAAIHSAGGRALPLSSGQIQYRVREPYHPGRRRYRLLRGVLPGGEKVKIVSLMDEAAVYLDGPHLCYPIRRGDSVTIEQSGHPVYAVW